MKKDPEPAIPEEKGKTFPFEEREKLLAVVSELWSEAGKKSIVRVSGISMRPILLDGESLLIDHAQKELKVGDIGVFRRNGVLFVHRVLFRRKVDDRIIYRTKGDWMLYMDSPIESDFVIGKVQAFTRHARSYTLSTLRSKIYSKIMVLYSFGISVDGKIAKVMDGLLSLLFHPGEKTKGTKDFQCMRSFFTHADRFLQAIFHALFFPLFHRGEAKDLSAHVD